MAAAETSSVGAITTALRRPHTYVGHVRELGGIARAVAAYPRGVFESAIRCGTPTGDVGHDTPVLMIHGFGHNRSAWMVLERHLRKAGFANVHTFNYNPLLHDVPQLAERLKERIDLLRSVTGAKKIHLVGHSLGGVLIRWYVQELGGADVVDTAITVATPHQGTRSAMGPAVFGRNRAARQLLPGSDVLRTLNRQAPTPKVRWVAYYSNLDLLIQPCSSAKLDGARNVLVKDHGHLSIVLSPRLARSIRDELETSEREPAVDRRAAA
jgi:triacylglycerol lipase